MPLYWNNSNVNTSLIKNQVLYIFIQHRPTFFKYLLRSSSDLIRLKTFHPVRHRFKPHTGGHTSLTGELVIFSSETNFTIFVNMMASWRVFLFGNVRLYVLFYFIQQKVVFITGIFWKSTISWASACIGMRARTFSIRLDAIFRRKHEKTHPLLIDSYDLLSC